MNDVTSPHPNRDQLSAFGLGHLDESASAALETHLAGCAACRTILETLPADSFLAKLQESARPESARISDAVTLTNPPSAPAVNFEVPPELAHHPRYRILQLLGAGGMGTVYRAEHQLMERPVALKVINRAFLNDPTAVERFVREVKGASRLCHPNIVTAYDAEQTGDLHFLVMEFVEGISLDRLVQEQGPLPVSLACDYVYQAALGLQHAHERGLVHRDIKPQNLMRTPTGRIKILDFGLARFARETAPPSAPTLAAVKRAPLRTLNDATQPLTESGTVMGTPDYMAPEQAVNASTADIRADIYSLGCTLYHLLSGQVPFPGGSVVDRLIAHAERPPRPLSELRPEVPVELVRVVQRMMAKEPAQRYQTPAEVAQALEPFLHAAPAALPEPVPPDQPNPPRRRWSVAAKTAFGFGAVGLLLGLVLFMQSNSEETMIEQLTTFFTVCAVLGGTLLALQFLLSLMGGAHGHEAGGHDLHIDHADHADHGHEGQGSWFSSALTFRAIVASLTFFGLAGRAALAAELEPARSLALAFAAGAGMLLFVAWLMRSLYRLRSDGTVRIQRAVGQTGTVYLSVPGNKAGAGKVHLSLQNRTVEYQAITRQETLPAGTRVLVVAVLGSDTVEVVPAPIPERITHV
jgi:serine/threonine protein kinase/membrane protein implicated in regulation of membrane protease activity